MTTPTTVNVRLQLRADTAANWTAANPTLLANEVGLETDTKKLKVGNGSSAWNSLAYFPSIVSGGTVLGNLEIGSTGTLTFEGSTADGFETTLAVTNPTADRTITLPNQSGTVVVSGNASIVDADIAANAEIAVSKLADGAARQLLQTDAAGTGVEWTSNVDIPGTLDVTGTATFDGAVTVAGDLTVNGTTTTISTQNLLVEDKNIILGDVATPSDTTADGGGITLKGATDKTINWVDSTDAWTSSERFSVPLGSAASPSLTFTGDENSGVYSPGADQVAISTNGSGRLFVDASGRVGVGVSSLGDIAAGYATLQIGGTNGGGVRVGTSSAVVGYMAGSASGVEIGATGTTALNFFTNNQTRATITSAGLVGVGTSSPAKKLEVVEGDIQVYNVNAVVNTLSNYGLTFRSINQFGQDRGTIAEIKTYLGGGSDNDFGLQFRTQATTAGGVTTKMTLSPAGQLGIGTTSPGQSLSIVAPSTAQAVGIWNRASDHTYGGIYFKTSDGVTDQSSILNERAGTNGASLLLYTKADGGSATERARIDSSGRLLVGTSSSRTVGIDGTIQIEKTASSTSSPSISITNNDNSGWTSYINLAKTRSGSNGTFGAVLNGDTLGAINFRGSSASSLIEAATITALVDGTNISTTSMPTRLVFSTTADGASSPTEALRIINSGRHEIGSAQQGIICGVTSAAGTATAAFVAKHSITQGSVTTTGTDALIIWSNGNVVNLNNSYGAISDVKLKENIVDATSQWSDIKALQVRKYNFKEGQTHTQIGVIAQEVELVSPGLVTESPDRDAEGNDLGTVTKSVNYSVLYMKAVKALQEAMERIELLEARLDAANL